MPGIGCTVHYAQQLQIELIDYIWTERRPLLMIQK